MSNTISNSMGMKEWALLIMLSTLWGVGFIFIEFALRSYSPLTTVMLRIDVGAILLLAYLFVSGQFKFELLRYWMSFLFLGTVNVAIPMFLITWAQKELDASLASILNSTAPIFSIILAHLFLNDEKSTLQKAIGVLVGFIGVVVLIGLDFLEGLTKNVLSQLAVLGAALCYGIAAVYYRAFFQKTSIGHMPVAAGQVTFAALILFFVWFMTEDPTTILKTPEFLSVLSIIGLGFFSTFLAYIAYFKLLNAAGAVNASLVTLLIPVTACVLGFTILGESLSSNQIVGMLIIGLGLLILDGRLLPKS